MNNDDRLEPLIRGILKDSDFLEALLNTLKRMKEAGIVNLANNIANDYLPTYIEFRGSSLHQRNLSMVH